MNRVRLNFIVFIITLLFTIAVGRAFYIQIIKHRYYFNQYIENLSREVVVKGYRGEIFDADHRALAISYPSFELFVDPVFFNRLNEKYGGDPLFEFKKEAFFEDLETVLSLKKSYVLGVINKYKNLRFVVLKRNITLNQFRKLKYNPNFLKSFGFVKNYKRFYPDGEFSAHIVGFCYRGYKNGEGAEGLERYYNKYLEAPVLKERVFFDNLKTQTSIAPKGGDKLTTTINKDIQDFVHIALKDTVLKHQAKSGMVVVMNPFDGSIIAMDSYPFYNNNFFYKFKYSDIRNRCITDVFEPGSVFKVVTMSAALDSGVFKGNEIIYCNKGRYKIKNKVIHDVHRFKYLSFDNVFVYSSNIGSAKIALKLGKKLFYKYLYKFGVGFKTGVDLNGEAEGIVKDIFNVGDVDLATMAFGQGIGVTEIQLARIYSAIANGGYLVRPHFMKSLISDSQTIKYKDEKHRILKPSTVEKVKSILRKVVLYGTGKRAALKNYNVAGKTGTAQIAFRGEYQHEYVASFAGFAPFKNPRFVVVVSIFKPQKGGIYGGEVAAPLFAKIMDYTLHYYGVKPNK